ncbi:MAG: right-handed parallel beta-helix repeat-containing protein [Spirochaetales bacterium]|nr:right-handed parallel beta-helix repeat-containing protein [Spirochaetales bacterium]
MKKPGIIVFLLFILSGFCFSEDNRPVIAILDFDVSGITKEEAKIIVDFITTQVIETGKYRVVDRMQRNALLEEMEWAISDCTDTKCQLQMGKLLSASLIIVGSLGNVGDMCIMNIKLIDVGTGETMNTASKMYDDINTLLKDSKSFTFEFLGVELKEDKPADSPFILVDSVKALLSAIQSNVVIKLKEGTYNISEGYKLENKNTQWEDYYDGLFPVIRSISNTSFIGEGKVDIVIDPSYSWVFEFRTSQNLSFENITFGHTKPGYCIGGVLRFAVCENIEIRNCTLYGSGTYGIELEHAYHVSIDNSIIKDCTNGLIIISNSEDISFNNTGFLHTGEYNLLSFYNKSKDIFFATCTFKENFGETLIHASPDCENIRFSRCLFDGNKTKTFIHAKDCISIDDCRFSNNSFPGY